MGCHQVGALRVRLSRRVEDDGEKAQVPYVTTWICTGCLAAFQKEGFVTEVVK